MMPGIEGPELCRRVRGREKGPCSYILLVTAKDGTDDVIQGLEAGADDYITKPCDIGELRARVGVGQRVLKLQNELIGAQEELRFAATHDSLTGLWNHVAIFDLLGRELRRMSRYRTPMGVLMVDIDHFKQVNDAYGHLNGDLVLKEVARRVEQAARSYDFVGRYGGEEFIVLLSDCHLEEIRKGGERVRLAVAATPIKVSGTEINVTVSVGAASISDANSQQDQDLLARADAALYRAKENGRDRLEVLIGTGA
jgi:diguanylate cyclase (GGDEF)-like protein